MAPVEKDDIARKEMGDAERTPNEIEWGTCGVQQGVRQDHLDLVSAPHG
jgi:hypothetical protein